MCLLFDCGLLGGFRDVIVPWVWALLDVWVVVDTVLLFKLFLELVCFCLMLFGYLTVWFGVYLFAGCILLVGFNLVISECGCYFWWFLIGGLLMQWFCFWICFAFGCVLGFCCSGFLLVLVCGINWFPL